MYRTNRTKGETRIQALEVLSSRTCVGDVPPKKTLIQDASQCNLRDIPARKTSEHNLSEIEIIRYVFQKYTCQNYGTQDDKIKEHFPRNIGNAAYDISEKIQGKFLKYRNIRSSAKSGAGTAHYFQVECSSHVTTYFHTFVRTFESMLCRGSNIRVKIKGRFRDQYRH